MELSIRIVHKNLLRHFKRAEKKSKWKTLNLNIYVFAGKTIWNLFNRGLRLNFQFSNIFSKRSFKDEFLNFYWLDLLLVIKKQGSKCSFTHIILRWCNTLHLPYTSYVYIVYILYILYIFCAYITICHPRFPVVSSLYRAPRGKRRFACN